ncbi:MAG: hypothetical protein ABL917_00080 [Parcubacteria group bacterium]
MPILYALLGGIGVVLFWRGVWHTTDFISILLLQNKQPSIAEMIDGPMSFVVGTSVLLITGVYVSAFIGNRLLMTGLSGEKKLAEKTGEEIMAEEDQLKKMQGTLNKVEEKISEIESEIKKHHG